MGSRGSGSVARVARRETRPHEEREPLVHRARQRESPPDVSNPRSCMRNVAAWSVFIASYVPMGSGNVQSMTPDPAGTSLSTPFSDTIAGRVNSSRIVSAEYGTPKAPATIGQVDRPVHQVDRTDRPLVQPVGTRAARARS